MRVYVVSSGYPGEGTNEGVFSTRELAQAYVDSQYPRSWMYSIEVFELDTPGEINESH